MVNKILIKRDVCVRFLVIMAAVIHQMMIRWGRKPLQRGIRADLGFSALEPIQLWITLLE